MWREYSLDYIKHNRSSSLSVIIAALISSLLLSLLCGMFYNAWKYEVERVELEEGSWQSRIVGELAEEDIVLIRNFARVKDVKINEKKSRGAERAVDLYFDTMKSVLSDTPRIAEMAGVSPEKVFYNHKLLAMYLIRDPAYTEPGLLPAFMVIMTAASLSLAVIIHNAFAVSMNARIHQFGIFAGIGAAPKQIQRCLMQEAAALCALPVFLGNLLGILGTVGLLQMANMLLGSGAEGEHRSVFGYHPLVLLLTWLLTVATIWISAWLPARKLSRVTVLEAIRGTGELQLKRRHKAPLLAFLFGAEGELAGNALKAQRKSLGTASLSLIFSFTAFTVIQCFFLLSIISTRETYFERYWNVWDIMVTVKDAEVDTFEETEKIQGLAGVESAVVYQKAAAKRILTEKELSEEMKSFGGFSYASGDFVTQHGSGWTVNVPLMILDDNSFLAYCEQIGIAPQLGGAIVINRICDVTNPDFRHPQYMPYVKEESSVSVLRNAGDESVTAEIPVLSYTMEVPVLREAYADLDYYELVHVIPASLWKEIKETMGRGEEESYIRVLGQDNASVEQLDVLQREIEQCLSSGYTAEYKNRIQEYETNGRQVQGLMIVLDSFCVLLAIIGIGNVFSHTFGFIRQRKREFARYMSIGMTPEGLRKMFCIEALVIALRPMLIALPLAGIIVWYLLHISYLDVRVFFAEAPFVPVAVFMLAMLSSVGLIYFSAWQKIREINLAEVLKDDTMM